MKEFYIEGHRYVLENVNIFLFRILHDLVEPDLHSPVDTPRVNIPAFDTLKLLDPSGAYTLDARVRVLDFNDSAVLESGVKELIAFQTQMDGCVELAIPDRNEMDTRVKYRPPHAPATASRPR
jgi:mediator of RNA polymerase II transcription subunit 18